MLAASVLGSDYGLHLHPFATSCNFGSKSVITSKEIVKGCMAICACFHIAFFHYDVNLIKKNAILYKYDTSTSTAITLKLEC